MNNFALLTLIAEAEHIDAPEPVFMLAVTSATAAAQSLINEGRGGERYGEWGNYSDVMLTRIAEVIRREIANGHASPVAVEWFKAKGITP